MGQSAILPSLALEELRDSDSGPAVYPWQLQPLASWKEKEVVGLFPDVDVEG